MLSFRYHSSCTNGKNHKFDIRVEDDEFVVEFLCEKCVAGQRFILDATAEE